VTKTSMIHGYVWILWAGHVEIAFALACKERGVSVLLLESCQIDLDPLVERLKRVFNSSGSEANG